MPRKSTGQYPANWKQIANEVKSAANWTCVRCKQPHNPQAGYCLTVHHLDLNPSNCRWWNLAPLCQRCHLQIQSKVVMEQAYFLPHSEWFRPYVAGYYAHQYGLPDDKDWVMERLDSLIQLGQRGCDAVL